MCFSVAIVIVPVTANRRSVTMSTVVVLPSICGSLRVAWQVQGRCPQQGPGKEGTQGEQDPGVGVLANIVVTHHGKEEEEAQASGREGEAQVNGREEEVQVNCREPLVAMEGKVNGREVEVQANGREGMGVGEPCHPRTCHAPQADLDHPDHNLVLVPLHTELQQATLYK